MGTEIDLPQILSHPLLVEKYLQNNGNGNGRSPAWPGPDLRPYLDFEANLTRLFDDTTAEEIRFQRRGPPGKKSRLDDDDLDPWQGIGDRKVVLSALSQDTPSSTAPTFAMSMGSFFEPSSKRSHPSISSSGSLSGFSDPPSSSTSDSSSLSFFSSASDSAASNSTDYGKEMSGPPSSRAPRTPLELARHSNLSSNAPEFVPTRAFFPPPSDSSYGQRIQTQQQPPPPPPRSRIYRTYAQSSGDGFYVRSFASERLLQKEKSQPQSGFQSLPPPPPMITGKVRRTPYINRVLADSESFISFQFAGSSSSRSSAAGSLLPLVPRLTAMRPQPPREKDIKGHHASSSRHNSHKMNSRFYRGTDRNTG